MILLIFLLILAYFGEVNVSSPTGHLIIVLGAIELMFELLLFGTKLIVG